MAEQKIMSECDPLHLRNLFPDAQSLFSFEPREIAAAMTKCLAVLDTNVRLVPYGTGKDSLAEIDKTLSRLSKEEALAKAKRLKAH